MQNALQVKSRTEISPTDWNAFVDSCDEAWLWHRFELQDAIATWPGKSDLSFAILDENSGNDIVAVVPLHLIEGRIVRIFRRNKLDSLGGVVVRNNLGQKNRRKIWQVTLEQLRILAKKYNVVQINLALSPLAPAFRGECCPRVNPLLQWRCQNTLTQTWVVDLRPGIEQLWQALEGRARTAIRKAEKTDVQVRVANRPGDLEIYYDLHCQTYRRTGVSPHPKAYFEAIWRNFVNNGLAYILFAERGNEVIAAENFGVYKQAAIYWTGAASDAGLAFNANSLLQWTAMQWMVQQGLCWYETGEAFPGATAGKLKGLNDFKKSFGGQLYPYYRGRIVTNYKAHLFDGYLALRS